MKVHCDGFEFDFQVNVIDAFVFDEKDLEKPRFCENVPMKKVDIIVELKDRYLFIELKDYAGKDQDYHPDPSTSKTTAQQNFNWLRNNLKYKYRDTFLFRFAEEKVEKPVHYYCLLTFQNALNTLICKQLRRDLPCKKKTPLWKRPIAESCHVFNIDQWNDFFPEWPLKKLP